MSESSPIQLEIRKAIFEKFNDPDGKFTNDEVFETLQKQGTIDSSLTIDDVEKYFIELCDSGLVRNIAQNFTTMWLKLFEPLEKILCGACGMEIYMAKSEDRICPNPSCKSTV